MKPERYWVGRILRGACFNCVMYEHPYSAAVLTGDRFKAIRKGYQNPSLIRPTSVRFVRGRR